METPASPEAFESAAYGRRCDRACDILIDLLEIDSAGGLEITGSGENALAVSTRLTAAVLTLLSSPGFQITETRFRRLAFHHERLADIAGSSSYGNLDLAVEVNASLFDTASTEQDRSSALLRLLLSTSLQSRLELPFRAIIDALPQAALAVYFPLVSSCVTVDRRAYLRRKELLALVDSFAQEELPDYLIRLMHRAWYMCSYDDAPDKHDFKRRVNEMVECWLSERPGVSVISESQKDRPVLVVAADVFHTRHALYRCTALQVAALRERFHLVLLCDANRTDDAARALFDRVCGISDGGADVTGLIKMVRSLDPDVIYYPGTGMGPWTLALLNTRLAPIQVVGQGHPATTRSRFSDFLVAQPRYLGAVDCYSETVVQLKDGSEQFSPHPDRRLPEPMIRERPGSIRVAVNSKTFKLSPDFMDVCIAVSQQATRPLEFVFFVGEVGFRHAHSARAIRRLLPEAEVLHTTGYPEYLAALNRCDIHLGTFPFGGTNTVVDSLSLLIPVVTLEGREPHSRADASLLRLAGLPGWLIADDREGYREAALRLIEDDRDRLECCNILRGVDFDAEFHDTGFVHHENDLVDCIGWLFDNCDAVRADGRRLWTVEAREAMTAATGVPA